MKEIKKLNFVQSMRRLSQKMNSSRYLDSIDAGEAQLKLIQKLYAKNGLDIIKTCSAMPEQYDVFKDGQKVAYYRLRHGGFTVDFPECGGEEIYSTESCDGDGCFESYERLKFMTIAMRELLNKINP